MIVGFIGLGTMGAPMARNIHRQGPSAGRVRRAAGGGRRRLPRPARRPPRTPMEVAAGERDRHHDAARCAGRRARRARCRRHRRRHPARQRLHRHEHDRSGDDARRSARRSRQRGAAMIDSPVGKTADAAVAGTLTLMVGGPADDRRALPPRARLHGHRFLPLRRARRRADDEAHQQSARHGGRPRRRSRRWSPASRRASTLDTMMSVLRTTMAWNNAAGDRDAQAPARRATSRRDS